MQPEPLDALVARWHALIAEGNEACALKLCRSYPELLPELQRRLARLAQMQAIGDSLPTVTAPVLGGSQATLAAAPPPAHFLSPGGYEVLAELGRGGMGVVFKARHLSLNRVVALKMILAGPYASGDELLRFRREAETVARLQHPGIVQIFEVGSHEGRPFLSLEFCANGNLDRKLAGTPLAALEAATLMEQLARAMQAAHAAGIVHRDLKPANVLLAEDGSPKITDFGLARRLEEEGLTATGAVLGTPSYMPPEQASTQGKQAGPQADVYSLGAILYECLTGRPPFKAATTYDTLMQVMNEEPVPPSQLNAKVPRDLETVCLKCLQKQPSRRYASAGELADDLARWLRGEPIRARPVGIAEHVVRLAVRRPLIASLLVALVALASTALVAISVLYGNALRAARDAREDRDRAVSAENRANDLLAQARARVSLARYSVQLARTQRADQSAPLQAASLIRLTAPELRGWEYRHLLLAAQGPANPHATPVESLAWSADGTAVIAAGGGHWARAWDVASGRPRGARRLQGQPLGVAISPDALHALVPDEPPSASPLPADGPDELEIQPRTAIPKRLRGGEKDQEADTIEIVQAAPERQAQIVLFALGENSPPTAYKLPQQAVSLRYRRDGWHAIALLRNGQLYELDTRSKADKPAEVAHLKKPAHGLALSPSESLVACLTGAGIDLVDTRTWKVVRSLLDEELSDRQPDFNSASFSPDGNLLAAADTASGKVLVWDCATGRLASSFQAAPAEGRLTTVCWLAGPGRLLATADRGAGLSFRRLDGKLVKSIPLLCLGGEALAVSPDGKWLAVGTATGVSLVPLEARGAMKHLDAEGWRREFGPQGPLGHAASIVLSGVEVSKAAHSGSLSTLKHPHRKLPPLQLAGLRTGPATQHLSADGALLAVASDRMIELRDPTSDKVKGALLGHTQPVKGVLFGPEGRLFSFSDAELKVWSSDLAFPLLSLDMDNSWANEIAFDGSLDCLVLLGKGKARLFFASKKEGR